MGTKRITIIIAILNNAIAYLWDGNSSQHNPYRYNPRYMCHAVEYAIAEVVNGDRGAFDSIYSNELYGVELAEKIMAAIPGSGTACGYLRKQGIAADKEVQAFRKQTLEAIRAEYVAMLTVTASDLATTAIHHLHMGGDTEVENNSQFTCHAVNIAARLYLEQGYDIEQVKAAKTLVKEKIAGVMGVSADQVSIHAYDGVLFRLLGYDFVEQQGFEWVQERRRDMLVRIAKELKEGGN